MSKHESNLTGAPANAAQETIDIPGLENLAGLVEDLTNMAMNRTRENLEEAVRQRLGPNVTLEDAERMLSEIAI